MCFTGDGVGKFSIKCTTQHRPVSSIKSSTASFKESSDVLNVKKGTYPSLKYDLKNGNVEIKFCLEYQYCWFEIFVREIDD